MVVQTRGDIKRSASSQGDTLTQQQQQQQQQQKQQQQQQSQQQQQQQPQQQQQQQQQQLFECSLRGSVADEVEGKLLRCLEGLCGVSYGHAYEFHEQSYTNAIGGDNRHASISLRVRHHMHALSSNDIVASSNTSNDSWSACYVGPHEVPRQDVSVDLRSVIGVPADSSLPSVLIAAGMNVAFGFIRRGVMFRWRRVVSITVSRLFQEDGRERVGSGLLVEATVLSLPRQTAEMGDLLTTLSTQLESIVNMDMVSRRGERTQLQ